MGEAILPGSISGGGGSGPWEHIGAYTNTTTLLAIDNVPQSVAVNYSILTFSISIIDQIPGGATSLQLYVYDRSIGQFRDSGYDTIQPRDIGIWTLIRMANTGSTDPLSSIYPQSWIFGISGSAIICNSLNDDYIVSIRAYPNWYIADRVANALYVDVYGIRSPF